MQTNPAVEQSKTIRRPESTWNQSVRKGNGLWGAKGFAGWCFVTPTVFPQICLFNSLEGITDRLLSCVGDGRLCSVLEQLIENEK